MDDHCLSVVVGGNLIGQKRCRSAGTNRDEREKKFTKCHSGFEGSMVSQLKADGAAVRREFGIPEQKKTRRCLLRRWKIAGSFTEHQGHEVDDERGNSLRGAS